MGSTLLSRAQVASQRLLIFSFGSYFQILFEDKGREQTEDSNPHLQANRRLFNSLPYSPIFHRNGILPFQQETLLHRF